MVTNAPTESPRLSVLVPAYNVEGFISKAIKSVLRQTEADFELVVIDDASTDNTFGKAKAFDDPRIRLIQNDANQGAQATRNKLMKHARGEWIAFLDGDDWFAPFRLERLLFHAQSANVDIVADNVYLTDYDLTLSNTEGLYIDRFSQVNQVPKLFTGAFLRSLPRIIGPAEFMRGHRPGPRNPRLGLMKPLFKRSFLQEHGILWDERVRFSQDTVFYLSCLMKGARFLVVPETGYFYRTESTGITESSDLLEAAHHRLEVNYRLIDEYGPLDPELRKALKERERLLERRIAFLKLDRLNHASNAVFFREVVDQPRDALEFASYWLERSLWRNVGRVKSIPRRIQAFRLKRPEQPALKTKM